MIFDRTLQVLARGSSRGVRAFAIGLVVTLSAAGVSQRALAVHVGTTPNVLPNTSVNPALCSSTSGCGTWTQGDPGWANAGQMTTFLNAVYLGDGWVISANHTGVAPFYLTPGGTTWDPIPNQTYAVANPTGVPGLTSATADLRLFRINGDPGLPSLTIASQPLVLNDEVVFASYGPVRAPTEVHWFDTVNGMTHSWAKVPSCSGQNCYTGYENQGGGKRWATNNVANDNILGGADASDSDITTVVNNGTIANLTVYDQFSGNPFEGQVAGGDSGSAVFHKRGAQWELAGIVVANYTFSGQSDLNFNQNAVYGTASAFADLSSYYTQITSILASHADYSIAGDINLDGVLNSADVSAFVTNWGYNNGTGLGSVTSWKQGDLNHDGKTDVADFFKMRTALGSPSAGAALATALGLSLGGGNAVPEPSALLLAMGPALLAMLSRRKRIQ